VNLRLASAAIDNWADVDGYAVAHGLPPLGDLPQGRFMSFMWWYLTRNASSQTDVEKFRTRLWRPPPGVVPTGPNPWSPENEQSAFAAFKAGLAAK
jgi:hypothetical protein